MVVVKVVDASAPAALLFGEPGADAVVARLENARLAAPALLNFELANIYVTKTRRRPEQAEALAEAFALRHRLDVAEMAVDHDEVAGVARATGLTGHDASYLWLARRLGAELVTLDRQLAGAASVF